MSRSAQHSLRFMSTCLLVVLVPAVAAALASWMIQLGPDASAAARSGTLPSVSQPTATRQSGAVTVSWPSAVLDGNRTPAGYVLISRNADTDEERLVSGTCAGTPTATECTDSDVPAGTWTWSVTAAQGTWRGPAGAPSNAVNMGSVAVTSTSRPLGAGSTAQAVTVSGNAFAPGAVVSIGGSGVTVQSANLVSATQLALTVDVSANATPGARSVTVTNPDGATATCASCFTVNPGPTVASATPPIRAQGTSNQTITLTGTNFNTGLNVAFSGIGITVNSTTRTSATTAEVNISVAANALIGARNITATNTDGGSITCSGCFTVTAPGTVSSVAPSTMGQGAISETVTLTGTHFNPGAAVTFSGSGITVESTTRVSATQLAAVVSISPTAATGARTVVLDNADGLPTISCTNCFTVATGPTISSTSPAARPQGSSVSLQINGTGYAGVPSVAISGTGISVTSVASPNTTKVTATLTIDPDAPLGPRTITVTNANLGAAVCSDCFTVNPMPTIGQPSPRFAARSQTLNVTIPGTNFQPGATAAFGAGVTVNSTTVNSATQITANITTISTATLGDYSVTVTNPDTGAATCTGCFTVGTPPTVTSTSPSAVGVGATNLDVTVNGSGFLSLAEASVSGTGVTVNSTTLLSATQLRVNLTIAANATTGTRDITVTNTNTGTGSCTGCFTVSPPPTLTGASPASRLAGTTNQNIVLSGTNFLSGATASFSGTGITVNSTTFNSATQLTANITIAANATVGTRNITVNNPGTPSVTCSGCFTVNPLPTISEVSPPFATRAERLTVSVVGQNFQSGATASFSGPAAVVIHSTTFVSPTQVNVDVTINNQTSALGDYSVTITNPDTGAATCSGCLTVGTPPTVTSTSPSAVGVGATNFDVTVNGTGFLSLAQASVSGTGVTVNSTTLVSSTQLRVNLTIASNATTGARNITVTNANTGTGSCTGCFTVNPPPTLSGASPASRAPGATNQNVVLTGTNFLSGATASFGAGITVNSTTFNSSTQLTANITVAANAAVGSRDITINKLDGGQVTCAGCFTVNPLPTVNELSPRFAARAERLTTSVSGQNFQSGATVSFSGPAAVTIHSTTFVSPTQVNVEITTNNQTSALGDYSVTVTNPDTGSGSCTSCFTVGTPPTVTSASPAVAGQGATALDVTVTGTGFLSLAQTSVSGTGITVNSTTLISATQVRVNLTIAANATTGARDITVTNANGGTATCAGCFTVTAPPTLTSASPNVRSQGLSNQSITLTGTNFRTGASVGFSGTGITVNSTTVNSATQITANVTLAADASTGVRNITVTNADNTPTVTCTGCFTVNAAPTLTTATPASQAQGVTNQTITLTGTNLRSGLTTAFSGTGITVNSTTYTSSTSATVNITIAAGATTGARNITITNTDGGNATCTSCFTITNAPTLTSASPNNAGQGATSYNITLTGTNLAAGATAAFSGTGITVNSLTVTSVTTATANITVASNATTGTRNITVTNTDNGTATCTGCFTINPAPTLTSASPNNRAQGTTNQSVTLTGTNFRTGAAASFSGTGITVNSTTFSSATQVTANITIAADATTGARSITVANSDGATPATCTGCFTVNPAPTIAAVSPIFATRSQTLNVTVTGTNFATGATTAFGTGITVNSTTVNSSTQITANITTASTATLGAYNVTITNTDAGTTTCTACFNVGLQPTLTSASPASAGRGATNLSVTLTGTNFASGLTTAFSGTGITVNSTSFVSATSATVNISVASNATLGSRDISITNTNGSTTACVGCFTVISPATVTSASPNNAGQGANIEVTVTGTNFIAGASVGFSGTGITVNSTTYNSATSLTASITIASNATTGARNITVTNGDGQTVSCSNCFTVNAGPTISSVSPSSITWKTNTTVTINGTNFLTGVTVSAPGATLGTVTRVSSTQITAVVNYGSKGTYSITVTNPDGGTTTCTNCITAS
jgi:hypothetical protein